MPSTSFIRSFAAVLLLSLGAYAQSAAPAQASAANPNTPVFRVQSKLVLVDVVVTDKSGKVVTGLKPSDFQVAESGHAQKIRFFEEHTTPKAQAPAVPPKLPEGQYTNFPTDPPKSTMNILLFDLLNTAQSDQVYAKKQMHKALELLPPGQQMSLFVLAGGLQMIQGPSGDTATLIRAAQALETGSSRMIKSQAQAAGEDTTISNLQNQAGAAGYGAPAPVDEQLRVALLKETTFMADDRVGTTLMALQSLARAVSAYPGRKNLIWITAGVPFEIGADMKADKYHRWREKREYLPMMVKAGSMLADAQVAIYPVDISGLAVQGVNFMASGTGMSASGKEYMTSLRDQHDDAYSNRVSMENLAAETGGRAFTGSNDLAKSITTAVTQGSRYYTLAYVPTNQKWDGNYRQIEVHTTQPDAKLTYRKGYLGVADKLPSQDEARKTLAGAMQLGMPASTSLLMRVQVQPPDKQNPKLRIEYAVAADEVQFSQEADNSRRATLDFVSVARNEHGKPTGEASNSLTVTIKPGTPESALQSGIPFHLELDLKPGKYMLCMGAMDRATQKIGTVWVPVIVPESK
jgi:VWFA-related protein